MTRTRKVEKNQRRAPTQARSRATVEAILDAAARIIRREGPGALTTNRIAEVAGVGVGSLYGYFPDKDAIQLALARRMLAQGDAAVVEAMAAPSGLSPTRAMVRTILALHAADKALRRAVMSVHIGLGHRGEHGESTRSTVAEIARRLSAQGLVPPDPLRLFIVTRAVLGVARALVEEPDGAVPDPRVLEDELMDLIRPYLAAPPANAAQRATPPRRVRPLRSG
ncbi:MAG TPA: TetR/AcrR family transcriptional regulator [Caulobacteraceae bacterium]|nr:TetR/AcrR family transcriptional regulator [Caulobacteraceae bacterium]